MKIFYLDTSMDLQVFSPSPRIWYSYFWYAVSLYVCKYVSLAVGRFYSYSLFMGLSDEYEHRSSKYIGFSGGPPKHNGDFLENSPNNFLSTFRDHLPK
jgi:hypothetical protein